MTLEQQFLAELPAIERVIAWVCGRRCLRGADAEDFRQTVMLRLVEREYEVLGKFQGRSSLKTYLTAVVNRMYLDFQAQRFGKWRPSAEARRLGKVALRLECLTYRDGLSFDEACAVIQSDTRVGETRDALYAMSQRLPRRAARSALGAAPSAASEGGAAAVERAERQALAERTFEVIRRALSKLPARDAVFLRLNFESGFTVAEAARSLGLEQKALYRRREAVLGLLREELERQGIGEPDVEDLVSNLDWDAPMSVPVEGPLPGPEQTGSRPSQGHGDSALRQKGEQ